MAVGEFYDDETKYRNQVKESGLEDCVRFVADYIPNDQVALYFSAADVVVLPYLSATQSGIAQIAYNFDKPVIATNVGGLAEVIVDGKTKYQFCNIPSVKNYPHKLKNVTAAMNVLFAHERGWIAYNKNLKNSD